MKTKEILSIVALAALGLCLLCSLAKLVMKSGDKKKKHCDKVCGAFVFLAIVLLAVSQLLGEGKEKYDDPTCPISLPSGSENCPEGQMPMCKSDGKNWNKGDNCLGEVNGQRICPDVCCCGGV